MLKGFGKVHFRARESDLDSLRQVFVSREYDIRPPALAERVHAKYRSIIDSGRKPVIVDAGANIGAASIWFARTFPDAAIVAVEPHPANAGMLRMNVDGLENCIVVEAGVGAEPGRASLSQDMGWAVRTTRSVNGVEIITLDDALARVPEGETFIVKIDIEGFESDLFASNTSWLDKCFAVIIEPHDWLLTGQMSSRTFQETMAGHPFELFILGENLLYVRCIGTEPGIADEVGRLTASTQCAGPSLKQDTLAPQL